MRHMGTSELETDRLILRRFTMEDAELMYRNWASDENVTKYLTWPAHANVSVTRGVLKDWIAKYSEADFYNWCIELKEIGEPIGNLAVVSHDDATDSATMGWCMGARWWGRGIMPEAGRAVLQYLFAEVGFNRIVAKHDVENRKSGRVMQKLSMVQEGTFRASGRNNRGVVDEVVYSILREDYEKTQAKDMQLTWRRKTREETHGR